MRTIHNLKQANQALDKYISIRQHEPHTLNCMVKLMNFLGNPQNKLRIIHIAGTSGKTSTSYYIASLLREIGHKVGLTISPHVDGVNERVQINMIPLAESDYCAELNIFLDLVDSSGLSPSYFEVLIAFAYWLFDKRHVDYAVIETGVGGLLDSTNIINRTDKICAITDIGFDHTEILGATLEKISEQKAGIVQTGNVVFMNDQPKKIMDVFRQTCLIQQSKLYIIEPDLQYDELLTSLPLFQRRNFKLALKIVKFVIDRDGKLDITDGVIKKAMKIYIPARMEIVAFDHKQVILDGSHNEQKIGALVEAVQQRFPKESMSLLVSFGANKQDNALASLKLLRQISSKVILTSFSKERNEFRTSMDLDKLAIDAEKAGFTDIVTENNPITALELLRKDMTEISLVTGSFYLLNTIRPVVLKKN